MLLLLTVVVADVFVWRSLVAPAGFQAGASRLGFRLGAAGALLSCL